MDLKVIGETTYGSMQPVQQQAAETTTNDTANTTEQVQAAAENVNTDTTTQDIVTQDNTTEATTETAQAAATTDNGIIHFEAPNFEEQQAQQAATTISWKDAIKDVNKKELLEAAGVDPFVIEMAEYIAKGGKPSDYVTTQAIDYKEVSHEQLVKDDLKALYPKLSADKLQKLYEAEYKQGENHDDEEKEVGLIRLEAKGEEIRQKRIQEQQARKIPEVQQAQPAQQQPNAEISKYMDDVIKHPATSMLFNTKGVSIQLPDGKQLLATIDNPNLLLEAALSKTDTIMKLTQTQQGAPDAGRLLENALHRINPAAYNAALYNQGLKDGIEKGKQEGVKAGENKVVNDDRNVGLPNRTVQQAATNTTFKQALQGAKVSTYGNRN